jgi:uncharacterized protein
MDKQVIKKIIIENQEYIRKTDVKNRFIEIDSSANYIFCGIRRSGKSFLLFKMIKEIIAQNNTNFVYLNFEDERFIEFIYSDFDLILECAFELFGVQPVLFFDEIQNITGWEKFARRLADTGYRICITGSNAKMLSKEMSSTLGGRYLIKDVTPLSFNEYLDFNNITPEDTFEFTTQRFLIKANFDSFFNYGGFPEISKFQNKREYMSSIYMKVFYGDLIARNHIQNEQILRLLIKKLAESVNNETSLNRIKNLIISAGIKTGSNTIPEYITYLQDAYLISPVNNYTSAFTVRESKKKYYFIDQGILNLFIEDQNSKLLENIAFLHLHRNYQNDICYFKRSQEVDFYIPKEKKLIQVCYSLSNVETKKREIAALLSAMKELNIQKSLIITYDDEEIIKKENYTISVLPIWKWLLQKM